MGVTGDRTPPPTPLPRTLWRLLVHILLFGMSGFVTLRSKPRSLPSSMRSYNEMTFTCKLFDILYNFT